MNYRVAHTEQLTVSEPDWIVEDRCIDPSE